MPTWLALTFSVLIVAPVVADEKVIILNPTGVWSGKIVIDDPTGGGMARVGFESIETIGQSQIVSSIPGTFTGININSFVGADSFYGAGYTGSRSVVANVEPGHIWNGHETLKHVSAFIQSGIGPQNGEYDRHATWVGGHLGGRLGGNTTGEYQRGIAHDADLWSGAVATDWIGVPYSIDFNINGPSFAIPYNTAFASGIGGRTADVVNSSWGFDENTGFNFFAATTDGLANQNPFTTFVAPVTNSGPNLGTVKGFGAAHNVIGAAALGPGNDYHTVSGFSSRGPSPYADPVNGIIANARATVDLAAPGQNLTGAYYGGTTGGNSPVLGPPSGPIGGPDSYTENLAGTSFASAVIAGGATLMTDAAYDTFPGNPSARDGRVVKAVLLNSAAKIPGWDNGQFNAGNTVVTFQSLDLNVGAGVMDLDRAFQEVLFGTTDVPGLGGGTVGAVGWDFGTVGAGSPTDYLIGPTLLGGTQFNATLAWNRDRSYFFDPFTGGETFDDSYDDLDLEIWEVLGNVPTNLVASSLSTFNNVEHLSFTLPDTGKYLIRAKWFQEIFDLVGDDNFEFYGLAWSGQAVPEPASAAVWCGLACVGFVFRRRRRRARASVPTVC